MSIALAIIAKDQVREVQNICLKYAGYFDEIHVAADENLKGFNAIASQIPKLKVHKYNWINDFSNKRNFLAEKITSEFYLRLDTDDDIENPEIIRDIVKTMKDDNFDVFYVPYIYAKDPQGNCIAKHWRETIIRKREGIYWKKPIHENVFIEKPQNNQLLRDDRLKIIHNIDAAHAIESYDRNLKSLMEEFRKDGANTDPRTIAYLGRMLMARGEWEKATLFLENLTKRSGWDDDKYFAWVQMSQCYQQLRKYDIAIGCCHEAMAINMKFPDAFLQMGSVYLNKLDYDKAVDWIMPGIVRPEPDTVMVIDPTFYGYKARINAALALLGKGDIEKANKYFDEAEKLAPKDEYVQSLKKMFKDTYADHNYLKNLIGVIQYTHDRDKAKVAKLIESMPSGIFKDERACGIRNRFMPARTWGDNELAIFCGQAWEDWSPISTLKGIGGSEEAVIYISKELTKLGFEVTIFNSCGDMEGDYEGVHYRPYYAFNPNDRYSNIIAWRGNMLKSVSAKRRIVWLHDVPSEGMFTAENIKDFDRVMVLSEFHKSLLPACVPQEKVFVSANGINAEDFHLNGTIRNPHRAIYTSSYDRGLQHLLEIWPEVRKEVPDAELAIFYGWNTYDKMMEAGRRPKEFKNAMVELMNQPGIKENGRIGHKQLNKEFQRSGVWAYPSHFEEISCISAMKAQANGCVPVCTDYAALKETVKAGVKIEGSASDGEVKQKFKESLVQIFKDEKRQELLREEVLKHKNEFSWEGVAKSWAANLLPLV